ncbi:hypothetical protein GCM10009716_13420 [Streptomyces sodiiphilus]|uniref:Uncharacterized protein n=1 Tax=Streptomyces sodiiphilus TaxID=226217 RepID=A0ABN2NZ96_9ACTN
MPDSVKGAKAPFERPRALADKSALARWHRPLVAAALDSLHERGSLSATTPPCSTTRGMGPGIEFSACRGPPPIRHAR